MLWPWQQWRVDRIIARGLYVEGLEHMVKVSKGSTRRACRRELRRRRRKGQA